MSAIELCRTAALGGQFDVTTLDGSQLDPEECRQYEAGIKYEPRGFPALITASVFDIEISNLPNPNALPADASQQQGVSKIKGAEVEAQVQMGDLYLDASYSVLDAEDPLGDRLNANEQASNFEKIECGFRFSFSGGNPLPRMLF